MTADFSPVKNFPNWQVKQLFQLDILENKDGEYFLKEGVELVDKRKKKVDAH